MGALAFVLLLAFAAGAGEPRIKGVHLAARGSLLVCGVETEGLPDAPSRDTLASGLPSALVLWFTLLDPKGRDLGGTEAQVRIEPDLWENLFQIRTPALDRRVSSLAEVETVLASLDPIPVATLDELHQGVSYRMRVRLAVHPLAPAMIERARGLFTGETRYEDPRRREVSIGLGSLIRTFLGRPDEKDWTAEQISPPFTVLSLPRTEEP